MMELLSEDTFPSVETFASLLPEISLTDWQTKYKYNKDTNFYCGWSFQRFGFTTTVLVAGYESTLRALLIYGFIEGAGHGWTEQRVDNFEPDPSSLWIAWKEVFKTGPKTAEELNKTLPEEMKIPLEHSALYLPGGEKIVL